MSRLIALFTPVLLAGALALAGCAGAPITRGDTQTPPVVTTAPTEPPATSTNAPTEPVSTPTSFATTAPTDLPATATSPAVATATVVAPVAPTTVVAPSAGTEILFLRERNLVALDLSGRGERVLAAAVLAVAATPDGSRLAVVRATQSAEVWLMDRSGAGGREVTANDRFESDLSWAPDGQSLAYTAATAPRPAVPSWEAWATWCAVAEARVLDVATGVERTLGAGCEPTFSPDGRRIAFVTPPGDVVPSLSFAGATNGITIVNRQGENGWSVALADGVTPEQGYLVYGPAWVPDGTALAYQRFLGYQALVDINLTEMTSSYERKAAPIGLGAGWLLPPAYAPDGKMLLVTEHNFSDARGFGGYDAWQTTVLRLGESHEEILPSATLTMSAVEADHLDRATAAAWSPDGAALAVSLPQGWQPGLTNQEPVFSEEGPGELWRWQPGTAPETRLADGLDFGSPLLWLPAPPTLAVSEARVALAVPQGWGVREGPADYWAADGRAGQVTAARLIAGAPPGGPEGLFPELLAPGATLAEPYALPDGSVLRGITGTSPDGRALAGILRLSADGRTASIYLTTPAAWPLERAYALALVGASG